VGEGGRGSEEENIANEFCKRTAQHSMAHDTTKWDQSMRNAKLEQSWQKADGAYARRKG